MTDPPPHSQEQDPPPASRELERRILGSTGWVALGHGGRQVATFLSLLVLARLLDPQDFGLFALAWAILAYAQHVQETGIGQAFIHRRTDVGKAAASVAVFSPLISVLSYAVVFAAAPLFARLFQAPELVDVLRVMAVVLVIRGFGVVPGGILERDLDFRSRMVAELGATVAQVAVSIGLALSGAGVWSIVFGHLAGAAAQTGLYWLLVPWRPSLRNADSRILRELFRYGRYIGAFNILTLVSNTADDFVVGRALGTSALGVYSVVYRLASFPNTVLAHIVGRPMFSVYSMLQDDLPGFRYAYVRNLQRVALVAVPVSVGMAVAAEPIVDALLGEKWLTGVTALHILAVYGLLRSFGGVTAEALKGIGKPEWNLAFGVVYAAVVIPALVVLTPPLEMTGAALAMLAAIAAAVLPALVVTAHTLRLSGRQTIEALAPSLLCSAVLAAVLAGLLVSTESLPPAPRLALLTSVGLLVYVAATALFARSIVVSMWLSVRPGRDRLSPSENGSR